MSKEQTPITAEEIIDELIDIIKNPQNSNKEWVEAIIITAKEYDSNKVINAKVLEALEPIRKEIQEIKNINQSMKIDLKLAKSLLKEF